VILAFDALLIRDGELLTVDGLLYAPVAAVRSPVVRFSAGTSERVLECSIGYRFFVTVLSTSLSRFLTGEKSFNVADRLILAVPFLDGPVSVVGSLVLMVRPSVSWSTEVREDVDPFFADCGP
jgi:hypothetical protein